jgi:spermidine synthase
MPLFTGTEFVVGALFAGWLFWVGSGALVGGRLAGLRRGVDSGRFIVLAGTLAVLLPATVIGIRFGRGLIARPPGALPPLGQALTFSLLVTAPFGFAYGAVYNVASTLWRGGRGGLRGGISRVYLWEAAGSFFGALLFSFVLIVYLSQFQAALIAALIVVVSAVSSPATDVPRYRRVAAVLIVALALGALSPAIDRTSIASVYRGFRIEKFYASRYGEVVVAAQEEVQSVFAGGGRLFSYPEPERTEEIIHIPLLMCREPRSVLLIGSSLGGGLEEARKHLSVTRIDCVELDGSLFGLGIGGTGGGSAEPGAARFIATDGRFYLSRGSHRYDCIILNSPPPVNLQWNRFYTREFFESARRSLNPGGVFAFTHPSSENYLTAEQAKVLRIIELTLESVFARVVVLPGSTVHFIASDADLDPALILPRLKERGIDAPFVGEDYLPYRFTRERLDELRADLAREDGVELNTDAKPALPFHELILEGSRAGSRITAGFKIISRVPPHLGAAVFGGLILALFGCARRGARARLAVWSVGFGSFLFQLLVLLWYQSFSGILYRAVALMTALFMAGAALGALLSIRRDGWGGNSLRMMHGGFIVLALALALWPALPNPVGLSYAAGSLACMLLAACGGFLTGAYYPVVVRTAFPETGGSAPATFYAWDMFGACIGGITGGIFLFPVVGLAGTALFIAFVHASALFLLAGRW